MSVAGRSGVNESVKAGPIGFGRWALQGDGRLMGEGTTVQLPPKEWHVLRLLLASATRLVSKDRLLALVWPDGTASEESLTRCIYSLRKHLKSDKGFITTVYGRGYRFNGPVLRNEDGAPVCPVCGGGR
ncbi:winged helix-turn-helix domain-containing protein [Pseudomonas sp. SDO528_S397]